MNRCVNFCQCIDVYVGSYESQVELPRPSHMPARGVESPTICVDKCLEEEIKYLWSMKITTTGCCCGHNKVYGFIGVLDKDIPRMKEIGYKVALNPIRPDDEDSFRPKYLKRITQ